MTPCWNSDYFMCSVVDRVFKLKLSVALFGTTLNCLIWDHIELPYMGTYSVALFGITLSCLIWDNIELPYLGSH